MWLGEDRHENELLIETIMMPGLFSRLLNVTMCFEKPQADNVTTSGHELSGAHHVDQERHRRQPGRRHRLHPATPAAATPPHRRTPRRRSRHQARKHGMLVRHDLDPFQ